MTEVAGFARNTEQRVVLWTGDPTDQTAHLTILAWLRDELEVAFRDDEPSASVKGNLGESIAFMVGCAADFSSHDRCVANAIAPLENVSKPGIDITWFFFDTSPANDVSVLQEVKTTGEADLSLADGLTADAAKLFGMDPQRTLHTRLRAAAAEFRCVRHQPDLAARIRALSVERAELCTQIKLVPTLLHDSASANPVDKLFAVRESIASLGFDEGSVTPWSISFGDLNDRLLRLSHGDV